jgi:D-glycero-beta-D-manno-heptose-7-phosphate kinase
VNKTNPLLEIVDKFHDKKITVWGDFILDEYVYGVTRRISREAPVLILSYQDSRFALGGAGNSILNLKSLGAEPRPVGITGDDEAGKQIGRMMESRKISLDSLIPAAGFRTPTKIRILAGERGTRKQQILRIDKEEQVPNRSEIKIRLKETLARAAENSDALIISDYNYFTVREDLYREILPVFRKKRIPVSLDSRFRMLRFPGPNICTPNEPEAAAALHLETVGAGPELEKNGSLLLQKSGAESIVLTRGCRGMTVFEKNKPPVHIPVFGSADIVDVTGAGDTVISVFTLALTAGADTLQAARLANYAGGLAVMKKGTALISTRELKEAVSSQS